MGSLSRIQVFVVQIPAVNRGYDTKGRLTRGYTDMDLCCVLPDKDAVRSAAELVEALGTLIKAGKHSSLSGLHVKQS